MREEFEKLLNENLLEYIMHSKVSLYGNNFLVIEGRMKICSISKDKLIINSRGGVIKNAKKLTQKIQVEGQNLVVVFMNSDILMIKGTIKDVLIEKLGE